MKNAAKVQDLKIEIIQWLTKVSDRKTLEKILEIKEDEEPFTMTPQQEDELENRLKRYLKGESNFKNWEDAKTSIRKRARHAL